MSEANSSVPVVHDAAHQRFECRIDDQVAVLTYTRQAGRVIMDHTYVPDALRGKGLAAALVRTALAEARAQHWKIIPQCSYVEAYLQRHPEYADLLASPD